MKSTDTRGLKRATVKTDVQEAEGHRVLFHSRTGGIDFARLFEQLIPTCIIGALVIYANSKVTEYQVMDLRRDLDRAAITAREYATNQQLQSEKLAAITAQITAFLGQQTQLNSTMDGRMTYLERARLGKQ